jgi:hypothetical protein
MYTAFRKHRKQFLGNGLWIRFEAPLEWYSIEPLGNCMQNQASLSSLTIPGVPPPTYTVLNPLAKPSPIKEVEFRIVFAQHKHR